MEHIQRKYSLESQLQMLSIRSIKNLISFKAISRIGHPLLQTDQNQYSKSTRTSEDESTFGSFAERV